MEYYDFPHYMIIMLLMMTMTMLLMMMMTMMLMMMTMMMMMMTMMMTMMEMLMTLLFSDNLYLPGKDYYDPPHYPDHPGNLKESIFRRENHLYLYMYLCRHLFLCLHLYLYLCLCLHLYLYRHMYLYLQVI